MANMKSRGMIFMQTRVRIDDSPDYFYPFSIASSRCLNGKFVETEVAESTIAADI